MAVLSVEAIREPPGFSEQRMRAAYSDEIDPVIASIELPPRLSQVVGCPGQVLEPGENRNACRGAAFGQPAEHRLQRIVEGRRQSHADFADWLIAMNR
jgi:hypothetical protein